VERIVTICCLLFLVTGLVKAQSLEKRAIKNNEKQKWEKAESLLLRASAKNPTSPITFYSWSSFYFTIANPHYNVDSAYAFATRSLESFAKSNPREREKFSKFPLDSMTVVQLRAAIDSVAFGLARAKNTEQGYIEFLEKHPFSSDRVTAQQLRNAVAFLAAINQNTYTAFKKFLEKYPEANEREEALARYERLLFEEKTRDRRLASFESFLKEYPQTPFRKEIEKDIFELFTLSGEVERFMSYLKLYPDTPFQKRATNILFHILYDGEDAAPSGLSLTDSLETLLALNERYLVPFMKRGKFGFMNNSGFEVIAPSFDVLPEDYTCGNVTEDILVFSDRIINRKGSVVFKGQVDTVDDLGSGFLKVTTTGCSRLIHKSGFQIDSCIRDARMLDKRFIAVETENGWSIRSLTGRPVLSERWDEILLYGNVIALKKDKNDILVTFKQLADLAHEQEFAASTVVDQVKLVSNGMLWVSAGGQEGVYDAGLKEIVPLGDHKIQPYIDGFVVRSVEGFSLYGLAGEKSSFFENVVVKEPVIIVTKNQKDFLFNTGQQNFSSRGYDSTGFDGPFFKGWTSDSVFVHFQSGPKAFRSSLKTSFIAGKDSSSFISIELDGKRTVYDNEGIPLFTLPSSAFENIQHAGGDFFIVSKKEKRGLIDVSGKSVLPTEYDAIGPINNQTISILKAARFGLFNIVTRKFVKPQYDKNVIAYRQNLLIGFKEGHQGFIDWENKPQSKFEFDEVKYWNDTIALVRKNKRWEMLDLFTGKVVLADIRELVPVRETASEKLFIMNQNNLFGVLSSVRGKIIPFSFSDLVNVGSTEEPLYFTEKHVSEASVFVVIYYDRNGKMLRREVYEEADDYEKIYCQQN
jgi:hypothetical protein